MQKRPITIKRGDYYSHKINLPAEDENAVTIDWTGATFAAQIRRSENNDTVIAEFQIDDSHTDEDPPYVVLYIDDATVGDVVGTEDLPAPSEAVWDFQETRDSKPRTPFGGKVKITADVTRD